MWLTLLKYMVLIGQIRFTSNKFHHYLAIDQHSIEKDFTLPLTNPPFDPIFLLPTLEFQLAENLVSPVWGICWSNMQIGRLISSVFHVHPMPCKNWIKDILYWRFIIWDSYSSHGNDPKMTFDDFSWSITLRLFMGFNVLLEWKGSPKLLRFQEELWEQTKVAYHQT